MKTIIEDFVLKHEDLLKDKKRIIKNDSSPTVLKNTLGSFLLSSIIFGLFGFVLDLFDNLHYVILGSQFVIIFTYWIYLHSHELQYQKEMNKTYKPVLGYLYDLSYFIFVMTSMNVALLVLLYKEQVNILFTIIFTVLSLLSYIVVYLYRRGKYFDGIYFDSPLLKGIYVFALYYLLDITFDIASYGITYLVSTSIVITVLIIKSLIVITGEKYVLSRYVVSFLILLIASVYALTIGDIKKPEFVLRGYFEQTPSEYSFDINNLFAYEDKLYYLEDETLYEYDETMSLTNTINPNLDNIMTYYFDSKGTLKVLVYEDQDGVENTKVRVTQYDLSDISNPREEFTSSWITKSINNSQLLEYEGSVYDITNTNNYWGYTINGPFTDLEDYEILYQDPYMLVFKDEDSLLKFTSFKDDFGYERFVTYSNNKVFVHNSFCSNCVYDVSELGQENLTLNPLLDFTKSFYEIDMFVYDGEYYYLNGYEDYQGILYVYDNNYQFVTTVEDSGEIFMTKYLTYQVLYDELGNAIEYNEVELVTYIEEIKLFDQVSLTLMLVFLGSIYIRVPVIKEKEIKGK